MVKRRINHLKNKISHLVLILLILITGISCIDKYLPDIDEKYTRLLVVDGMISNKPGPYTIKLSYSSTISHGNETIPAAGFHISIADNLGSEELLIEKEKGIYETSNSDFIGVIGREYKLNFISPTGEVYESDYNKLIQPVEIESIYAEIEYKTDNNLSDEQARYQFYIDTYQASEDTSFLIWRLTETYKYNADYLIRWEYDHRILTRIYNSDTLYTCWKTQLINKIYTFNTSTLIEPKITKYPLHYRATNTRHLSIRYSLNVKQLTVNSDTYIFWNNLKNMNDQEGLYSEQPYQVNGNIRNITNPDEIVLGYFMVAGISEMRIFMDRPTEVEFNYPKCELGAADFEAMEYLWMSPSHLWPIYLTEGEGHAKAYPHQVCIDCTRSDGSLEKPEFWID